MIDNTTKQVSTLYVNIYTTFSHKSHTACVLGTNIRMCTYKRIMNCSAYLNCNQTQELQVLNHDIDSKQITSALQ